MIMRKILKGDSFYIINIFFLTYQTYRYSIIFVFTLTKNLYWHMARFNVTYMKMKEQFLRNLLLLYR